MKIAVVFVGALHDRGFNAAALIGATLIGQQPGMAVEIVDGLTYDTAPLEAALRAVAARSDGVIFVGGQGNGVTPPVAADHPDTRFAVVQGHVIGPNLASYDVLQEQSAFLAGCLAARMTRSGVVGHLSGHRVVPGLKGRAAFLGGVRHASPDIRVLTGFCGTQDDSAVARHWTEAEIAHGADIVFTMLNGARQGAIDACRAAGVRQIGNALDWCSTDPEVFIGSAMARIDLAVMRAAEDMRAGHVPATVQRIGLDCGDAVALSLAPDVPGAVAAGLAGIRDAVARGTVTVPASYEGPEFMP